MCCLFGFVNYSGKKYAGADSLVNNLAQESTIRGVDSTGVAYNKGGKLRIYKRPLSAYEMTFQGMENAVAVTGHTRHATQGSHKDNFNNHPFPGNAGGIKFALSHNGVLWNDCTLRKNHGLPATKIKTDSYIAVQLLEHFGRLDFATIGKACEMVSGSFTFSLVDQNDNLWIAKGDSPLSIVHFPHRQLYVYASTTEILFTALCQTGLVHDIASGEFENITATAGEILRFSPNGNITRSRFDYDWFSGYDSRSDWRSYGGWNFDEDTPADSESQYFEDLVAVGRSMGFTRDDIEQLQSDGFTLEEIEDFFYTA